MSRKFEVGLRADRRYSVRAYNANNAINAINADNALRIWQEMVEVA
jgi:hypothetical protein